MRRTLALVALAAGLLTLGASPAGAITGNYQQDFAHPYVGLVAFYGSAGSQYLTGNILSPDTRLVQDGPTWDGYVPPARGRAGVAEAFSPARDVLPCAGGAAFNGQP